MPYIKTLADRLKGRVYDPQREYRTSTVEKQTPVFTQGDGRTCQRCRRNSPTSSGICLHCGTVLNK